MGFKKLTTTETIDLPIGDHTYTFDALDADLGLFLTELASLQQMKEAGHELSDDQVAELTSMAEDLRGSDFRRRMLGPAFDEMRANGVDSKQIQLVVGTVMIWTVNDRASAEEFWNNGGRLPKGRRPQDHLAGKGSASRTRTGSTTRTNG